MTTRPRAEVRLAAAVAGYRVRATAARSWGGVAAIVVLIGLLGGVAMAAVAAARRTQASFPVYLASTNPSDLNVSVYSPNNGAAVAPITTKLARLPDVRTVRTIEIPHLAPISASGAAELAQLAQVNIAGSTDGQFSRQDKLSIVQGRLADPSSTGEIVVDENAARILRLHVGSALELGVFRIAEGRLPGFGTPRVQPVRRIATRVVGVAAISSQVVEDDIDRQYGFVFVTPALLRFDLGVNPGDAAPIAYAVQLRGGASDVVHAEREITALLPPRSTIQFHVTSHLVAKVELALRPESVAIGAFGIIAGLACLVLALQAIARQLREGEQDRRVLRALGAGRAAIALDRLPGVLTGIAAGTLLAVTLALLASPLGPFGPVRSIYPSRGIEADWTVLLIGAGVLLLGLGAGALAWSIANAERIRSPRAPRQRSSAVARSAEAAGLPISCVVGVRFALESGQGRTSVPLRSTLVGTSVAILLVTATLTFASSFRTLVTHPPLYGWAWNYALTPTANVPHSTLVTLDHDPLVAGWDGVAYANVTIDGQSVPVLVQQSGVGGVGPPVLSGHGIAAPDQIVIGAATLAALHAHLGSTVTVSYGSPSDRATYVRGFPLRVVGTATFPAIGYESVVGDHTSMGTGAMFSVAALPRFFRQYLANPDPTLSGPQLVFVRLRPSVSSAAGRRNLEHIAQAANRAYARDPQAASNVLLVLGVQRPAQIVAYGTVVSTPLLLAMALAAGALVALALTLIASVRRRQWDLAILKALGCTPRQLGAAIAWQAAVVAMIGLAVGVPLGLVAGRQLWILFAKSLNAVPEATMPVGAVALVVVGSIAFAVLVAMLPARTARRAPTTTLLRVD